MADKDIGDAAVAREIGEKKAGTKPKCWRISASVAPRVSDSYACINHDSISLEDIFLFFYVLSFRNAKKQQEPYWPSCLYLSQYICCTKLTTCTIESPLIRSQR